MGDSEDGPDGYTEEKERVPVKVKIYSQLGIEENYATQSLQNYLSYLKNNLQRMIAGWRVHLLLNISLLYYGNCKETGICALKCKTSIPSLTNNLFF